MVKLTEEQRAAQEQADREAQEQADREAKEQADREARERAAQEQADREAPANHAAAVRLVMAAFGAALPGDANSSGHYQPREGGPVHPAIRDGKFRVIGSDWAGRFEGGRLVEAFRCVPPHFGGDDIEIVN